MEGEPDLPNPQADSKFFKPNLSRPISIYPDSINLSRSFYANSTGSSTTSSSSSSPPEFVRHVQASFKRHCPTGMMQSNIMKPRRFVVPERGTSKDSNVKPDSEFEVKKKEIPEDQGLKGSISQSKNRVSIAGEHQEDVSIAAPSEWASTVNTHEKDFKTCNSQRDRHGLSMRIGSNKVVASSCLEPGNVLAEVQKKVHFSTEINGPSCGASQRMATGMDDLLSHMDSLAVTEMELDAGDQVDISAAANQNWQHRNFQSMAGRTNQGFGNFLRNDSNIAMTQSSVVGSSCVTSTLINPTSAPMVSSTTYSLQLQNTSAHVGKDPEMAEKDGGEGLPNHSNVISQAISSITAMPVEGGKSAGTSKEVQRSLPQVCGISNNFCENNLTKGNAANVKPQLSLANVPLPEPKLENTKSDKLEKGASGKPSSTSRKKGYDPDSFFKVNGKFYQRLGKIGSGGSSEVHKVISSDCTIYALKKIRLKGRDYATAYGFCQEIQYLNKLKGKNNIIQLIDYEVTDKTLLQQVMNGCMTNKDARVKDDGHIYMVLEYGEIDLAHMLAQKWKELDGTNATINENWLRFYWQQILLAVNTIHEERIVHSDLKPANFLLVKGSLKLIDFGIAKAIMSDTTNIQRDSQVGTLSYMSPEAFMCNETDTNGQTIKCGRPSDIWSLGCILYQMVYGRTPFSEYKTFWAKFKIITDPNHKIIYEPVSNPWLLDLMKKCLAWDRNERWRIPELLQHQFIVPPVPVQSLSGPDQFGKLFQQTRDMLLSQLPNMSSDQTRNLLCEFSTICSQLEEKLQKSKEMERSD